MTAGLNHLTWLVEFRERSRVRVYEVVSLPAILDKPAGIRAIDACLTAHADLLPSYASD